MKSRKPLKKVRVSDLKAAKTQGVKGGFSFVKKIDKATPA